MPYKHNLVLVRAPFFTFTHDKEFKLVSSMVEQDAPLVFVNHEKYTNEFYEWLEKMPTKGKKLKPLELFGREQRVTGRGKKRICWDVCGWEFDKLPLVKSLQKMYKICQKDSINYE